MNKNMGNADRVIRILVAVAVLLLYFTHQISGTVAIIGLVVSGIFILTSFMGFCPIYAITGLSTCKKED